MKKFFKTHDISMKKDPETGKVVCKAVKNEICKTKNSEDLFKILNDYLGDLDD